MIGQRSALLGDVALQQKSWAWFNFGTPAALMDWLHLLCFFTQDCSRSKCGLTRIAPLPVWVCRDLYIYLCRSITPALVSIRLCCCVQCWKTQIQRSRFVVKVFFWGPKFVLFSISVCVCFQYAFIRNLFCVRLYVAKVSTHHWRFSTLFMHNCSLPLRFLWLRKCHLEFPLKECSPLPSLWLTSDTPRNSMRCVKLNDNQDGKRRRGKTERVKP